jgi:hypothetical protein
MEMANVYLKDGGTVQVPIESLENYLYDNADKIESRHHKVRRSRVTEQAVVTATTVQ